MCDSSEKTGSPVHWYARFFAIKSQYLVILGWCRAKYSSTGSSSSLKSVGLAGNVMVLTLDQVIVTVDEFYGNINLCDWCRCGFDGGEEEEERTE